MDRSVLATFIRPAPRRQIDLMQFVDPETDPKFDFSLPWNVNDWTFATDGKICVRVRPESGDKKESERRIPPFEQLEWNHDSLLGWRSLPKLQPIMRMDYCGCPEFDATCELCRGGGMRPMPSIVCLDGIYFDAKLYEKTQLLGCDYVHGLSVQPKPKPRLHEYEATRFRFDEGCGLLMPLDKATAERDIEAVKNWRKPGSQPDHL